MASVHVCRFKLGPGDGVQVEGGWFENVLGVGAGNVGDKLIDIVHVELVPHI